MKLKSLAFYHTVGHTLYGLFLALAGILYPISILSSEMPILCILSLLAMSGCLVCLGYVIFARKESSDEMSRAHMQAAEAEAYRIEKIMLLLLMLIGSLSYLLKWNITSFFHMCLPFLVGIGEVVIGIKFYKLEKRGE